VLRSPTLTAQKQRLLKASSIATLAASATGTQILGCSLPSRLAKIKAQPIPIEIVRMVSNGEVELPAFLLNVLTAPSLDVVRAFPAEGQQGDLHGRRCKEHEGSRNCRRLSII
jgi:hypothetical protein